MNKKFAVACFIASLSAAGVLAQSASGQSAVTAASSSSPAAYVYVSRPTHIDGFAASSSGELTPVPGSPFANTSVADMSVTKKFLFGQSSSGWDVYSFAISSKGSLTPVNKVSPLDHEPANAGMCADYPDIQVDSEGETLYVQENPNCDTNSAYLSYHIESNGDMQYIGSSGGYIDSATNGPTARLHFTGSGEYAYDSYCAEDNGNLSVIDIYKRESDGNLTYINQSNVVPAPGSDGYPFCAGQLTTDAENHLAVALQQDQGQSGDNGPLTGPYYLASYTAGSNGNLTTSSTANNMSEANFVGSYAATAISIDPTGKFLALAGTQGGFAVYNFDGGKPIYVDSDVKQNATQFQQFGWDKAHHLYALGGGKLFVYTVVAGAAAVSPAKGSPYSIPESSSVIVLDLQ